MGTQKYIVLRSREIIAPTRGDMGTRGNMRGPGMGTFGAPNVAETRLEEADLTKRERNDLRRDPRTRAIALPMPMKLIEPTLSRPPEAPVLPANTWGVEAVKAHESAFDGSGITVAVLDTGINPEHPAFNGVRLEQKNFTDEEDNDLHGHGTHCAGTICGGDVNGTRIGIARNVDRALIGKVLGAGGGTSLTIANGIQWAFNEGAHIISMSLGIDFPGYVDWLVNENDMDVNAATSMALEEYRANINLFGALADSIEAQSLFRQGCIIVAATGNESRRPSYEISVAPPAAGTGVISVGALAESENGLTIAPFSNNQADIAAPGVDIVSADAHGDLISMDGTSMATPHVAGVAALWAQRQLEETGRVEHHSLMAKLVASGTYVSLAADIEEDDVGTGIVQAPLEALG